MMKLRNIDRADVVEALRADVAPNVDPISGREVVRMDDVRIVVRRDAILNQLEVLTALRTDELTELAD